MNCFDCVLHEPEGVGVYFYGIFGHPQSSGCQHSQSDDDAVVACRGVIVETCKIDFQQSTQIGGKLDKQDWVSPLELEEEVDIGLEQVDDSESIYVWCSGILFNLIVGGFAPTRYCNTSVDGYVEKCV